jgi:hypothetical protein
MKSLTWRLSERLTERHRPLSPNVNALIGRQIELVVPFKSWCPTFPEGRLHRQMTLELSGNSLSVANARRDQIGVFRILDAKQNRESDTNI